MVEIYLFYENIIRYGIEFIYFMRILLLYMVENLFIKIERKKI